MSNEMRNARSWTGLEAHPTFVDTRARSDPLSASYNASMQAKRVLETCLYVQDLDAAERFYRDVLGLEFVARHVRNRHVFFPLRRVDGTYLLPERKQSAARGYSTAWPAPRSWTRGVCRERLVVGCVARIWSQSELRSKGKSVGRKAGNRFTFVILVATALSLQLPSFAKDWTNRTIDQRGQTSANSKKKGEPAGVTAPGQSQRVRRLTPAGSPNR